MVIEGNLESQHYCIKHAEKILRCKCLQTKPLSVWQWHSIFRAFHLRNLVRRDGPFRPCILENRPRDERSIQACANPNEEKTPVDNISFHTSLFQFAFSRTCINFPSTLPE